MIKYESDGDQVIKCTNQGITVLEDVPEELNQQTRLILKMASLLQNISRGVVNPGIRSEAAQLVREAKEL